MSPNEAYWYSSKEDNFMLSPVGLTAEEQISLIHKTLLEMDVEPSLTNCKEAIEILELRDWNLESDTHSLLRM